MKLVKKMIKNALQVTFCHSIAVHLPVLLLLQLCFVCDKPRQAFPLVQITEARPEYPESKCRLLSAAYSKYGRFPKRSVTHRNHIIVHAILKKNNVSVAVRLQRVNLPSQYSLYGATVYAPVPVCNIVPFWSLDIIVLSVRYCSFMVRYVYVLYSNLSNV